MKKHKLVSLTGGLGNQLFQYAAALHESDDFNVYLVSSLGSPRTSQKGRPEIYSFGVTEPEIFSRASWFTKKVTGYLLRQGIYQKKLENNKFFRATTSLLGEIILCAHFHSRIKLIIGNDVGFSELRKSEDNQLLIGYFQTYRWASSPKVFNYLHNLELSEDSLELRDYRELAAIEKPLVVHVRLGDYKNEANFGIITSTYYSNAIKKQLQSKDYGSIWLFSDELESARNLLPMDINVKIRCIHEINNSAAATLQVMRLGHGFVIANSTFSWWGAFLAENRDAKVIAPKPWFQTSPEPADLIPPQWIRCDSGW